MEEKIFELIESEIKSLDLILSNVLIVLEDNIKFLRVVIDSKTYVTVNDCVKVTKLINPIIDESNLIKNSYILDVCSKERDDK